MNGCFLQPLGEAACLPLQWVIKKLPRTFSPALISFTHDNAGDLTRRGCHRWAGVKVALSLATTTTTVEDD